MSRSSPARPVGLWLLFLAGAVAVQISLGGITRLTDSGLSITEWKPILGVIPPLDDTGWKLAFAKYQQIPQFARINSEMSLEGFKFIYFWEWFHRLWGRMLLLFFIAPLVVFWQQGRLTGLKVRLLGLLLLGGAQGVMGWVMVRSGLTELVYVSHLRLAAHFLLAVYLLGALVWVGLGLLHPVGLRQDQHRLTHTTALLVSGVTVQLIWGAFMAGLKAAPYAPTWPTINGQWFPSGHLDHLDSLWNDPLAVHFVHRGLAYLLTLGIGYWWWRTRNSLGTVRHLVLGLLALQVLLGILTTVQSVRPGHLLWLGVAHQLVGVSLFVALLGTLRLVRHSQPRQHLPEGLLGQGRGVVRS